VRRATDPAAAGFFMPGKLSFSCRKPPGKAQDSCRFPLSFLQLSSQKHTSFLVENLQVSSDFPARNIQVSSVFLAGFLGLSWVFLGAFLLDSGAFLRCSCVGGLFQRISRQGRGCPFGPGCQASPRAPAGLGPAGFHPSPNCTPPRGAQAFPAARLGGPRDTPLRGVNRALPCMTRGEPVFARVRRAVLNGQPGSRLSAPIRIGRKRPLQASRQPKSGLSCRLQS